MLATELEQAIPEHEAVVVDADHAARLDEDDRAQVGQPRAVDRRHLVELLLVLGEVHAGAAVAEQVLDLGRRIGRVEADRDPAHGDRRQVEDHPLGSVFAMDRHPVAGTHAQRQQSEGGLLDQPPGPVPRVLVPDAEVLLAHRDLIRCPLRPVPCERCDRRGSS